MSISSSQRELVRTRANYACEFCTVDESNTGGLLTIDHFVPQSKGGSDELENLIYCCSRCNSYKQDYFPNSSNDPQLWNPRIESRDLHFIALSNGILKAITPTGIFTIDRLRLNRPPLIAFRTNHKKLVDNIRQLSRYQELIKLLDQTNRQLTILTEEQNQLLEMQRQLIKILLDQKNKEL